MTKAMGIMLTFLSFYAINCARGQSPVCLKAVKFSQMIDSTKDAVIIDVRTPGEYAEGHIPHAINIDWLADDFDVRVKKMDTLKPVFIYCLSGHRSAHAIARLISLGFKHLYELDGGILAWQAAKLPEATIN